MDVERNPWDVIESVATMFKQPVPSSDEDLAALMDAVILTLPDEELLRLCDKSLRTYLGLVFVDKKSFLMHQKWLLLQPPAFLPYIDDVDKELINEVVENGLAALDDREVIQLTFSPIAIKRIRDHLIESDSPPSTAWDEDFFRAANHQNVARNVESQREIIRVPVYQHTVVSGFSERRRIETDSIYELEKLTEEELGKLIAELQKIQWEMWIADAKEFTELDCQFHRLLNEYSSHRNESELAMRFVSEYGHFLSDSSSIRLQVWREHQEIIKSLTHDDIRGAADKLNVHLINSKRRWLPDPDFEINVVRKNCSFYERMTAESTLCVSAVNVLPIEMDHRFRNSIGLAVADAVLRGSHFLYLRPSDTLLDRWVSTHDILGLRSVCEREMKEAFNDFQEALVEAITGREITQGRCPTEAKEFAAHLVRDHVRQSFVDDNELFMMTGLNSTIGLFRYDDQTTSYTKRPSLSDFEAFFEISEDTSRDPMNEMLFVGAARKALTTLIEDDFVGSESDLMVADSLHRFFKQQVISQPNVKAIRRRRISRQQSARDRRVQ